MAGTGTKRTRGGGSPAAAQAGHPALAILRTFLPFVRPHWPRLLLAILSVGATSLVGLLRPWPIKFLIDDVLRSQATAPGALTTLIALVGASMVAIAALQGLFHYVKDLFLSGVAQRVAFGLRRTLFAHLQRLPLRFHDLHATGDMVTRLTNDVVRVQELITDDLMVSSLTSVLQLVGMLLVMLYLDPMLGLIAATLAPLILLSISYYRRRIKAQARLVRDKEGHIASLAQETISSIRVVKAFGREDFEAQRFDAQTEEMLDADLRARNLEARASWSLSIVTAVALATMVVYGAHRVVAGALTIGTLVVFIQYMRDLQSPLSSLSRLATKATKALVGAERLAEVLCEPPAVIERSDARPAPRFMGAVRFDHVSFEYVPGQPVLSEVDLSIGAGEAVAIVGATGAGKSTLASLVLRLYEPTTGAVLIDGRDVREYTVESVVDQIAVVLQDSLLFRATIRENIAYGRPNASFAEIREAARAANCEEFVHRLPRGYHTVVGERGATLSGGQRQRIAIARSLIRNAPLLVLDEPTTGLDAEAAATVLEALERLMKGRTTIVIAHKLSTVRRADRIFVLDKGAVVETGTHEELLTLNGAYARAVQLQSA